MHSGRSSRNGIALTQPSLIAGAGVRLRHPIREKVWHQPFNGDKMLPLGGRRRRRFAA